MHDPGWHPELRAGERTTLEQVLDLQRRTVVAKVAGLTDEQAASHPLPATDMTVAGIVNHLAWAEDRWFQGRRLGVPMPEPWASGHDDPDWPVRSAAGETLDALVAPGTRRRATAAGPRPGRSTTSTRRPPCRRSGRARSASAGSSST